MQLKEVIDRADVVTVQEASRLLNRHPGTVRRQLRDGELVGRHWGRDWMIPILRDEAGRAVFMYREAGGNA